MTGWIIRASAAAALLATPLALGGCDRAEGGAAYGGGERGRMIAKCVDKFGRAAPDPSKGEALCSCMVDRLSDEGLEVTDVFGADRNRVMEITRLCGAAVGIPVMGEGG